MPYYIYNIDISYLVSIYINTNTEVESYREIPMFFSVRSLFMCHFNFNIVI